ncbi:rho GTPase-activating protein 26 isoform X4 [Strongylocentrotus purpuratus]|uniref:Rho GTPase-activating protein 26-like n=1 Tax=Strongylocentrotus purpuratus TaxID=7668 RepID=A0A7M7NIG2_STRPU|nr:rho GTPase-activating protein 26 isoform X4 [Strongylocentrotus purpuratus]|eukprot:XP_011684230.1 PREDICTED: rho GTPase-activating protein 26 isoform X4 [Strongylocentrotus purpuratus]
MVLSPLEFSECYLDSPEFREKLRAHENELDRTNKAIKELIRDGKALLSAARNLSKAQRAFSETLMNFNFECIGTSQTDAEIDISQSLKEFGRLIALIEDERDRMLEHAKDQLIVPLEAFRKEQVGPAKEGKKDFERQTEKFCKSLDSYVSLSTRKKEASLQEADATLDMERRQFHKDSLCYVFKMQQVQEKKKFEFVETLLGFMYSWLTFYHQGHEVSREFKPYMTELQLKLQNIRAGFDATKEEAENLMHKMMEKPHENRKNKSTQEGYLFMYEKRALGSSWIKQYCLYHKESKKLIMQQYVQTLPKVTSEEVITVLTCTRRMSESIEKRFCFDITVMEKPNVLTFQAVTEEERSQWMRSMGGKEPVYLNPSLISNSDENLLNDIGFHFIRKCIEAIESRGLDDQGLYRVVGVSSKVQRLTSVCLGKGKSVDKRKPQNVNLSDSGEWEIKTITSALKNYFRNLPEPLMTHKNHEELMLAAKQESKTLRVNDIHAIIHTLPEPNFEMLDLVIGHLNRVAGNCAKNLMTVANLGVCFGPTLMRPEEETMKAIMEIKFSNIIIEILISNYQKIFKTTPDGLPPALSTRTPTTNFPNSASSSISSSSSASSSSRASPRHATPNSTPKDGRQATPTDSTGSTVSREPSPRRPGETNKNKWNIRLRRTDSANRANNNATHLHNGNNGGVTQTLPRAPPFRTTGNSMFYTKPMHSPPPVSPKPKSPPPVTYRSRTPQPISPTHSNDSFPRSVTPSLGPISGPISPSFNHNTDTNHSDIPIYSQVVNYRPHKAPHVNHPKDMPVYGTVMKNPPPEQHGMEGNRSGEQSMLLESGRVAALRRRFLSAPRPDKPVEAQYSSSSSHESISSQSSLSTHSSNSSPPTSKKANSLSTGKSPPQSMDEDRTSPLRTFRSPSELPRTGAPISRPPLARADEVDNHEGPIRSKSESSSSSASSSSQRSTGPAASKGTPGDQSIYDSVGKKGICVRTLYACDADNESELSFQPNQIIVNVRSSKERGWLLGTLNGKTGLVPENYVQAIIQ